MAAQFGDGFLELDFEDDHEAIAQEKFYKSLAESQRMQQNEEKSKPKPKPIIKNNPPGNLLFLWLIDLSSANKNSPKTKRGQRIRNCDPNE